MAVVIKVLMIRGSKCKEADVDRLAIMQYFRHDLKKKLLPVGNFGFYFNKIYHGLSLCENPHFVFIFIVQLFYIVFESRRYHKITQIVG